MKKTGLILAGVLAALLFLYGALSALVNQGLSLGGAILVFGVILLGGTGLLMLLREKPGSSQDRNSGPPT